MLERVRRLQLHPSIFGNSCVHPSIFRAATTFTNFCLLLHANVQILHLSIEISNKALLRQILLITTLTLLAEILYSFIHCFNLIKYKLRTDNSFVFCSKEGQTYVLTGPMEDSWYERCDALSMYCTKYCNHHTGEKISKSFHTKSTSWKYFLGKRDLY